MLQTIWPHGLFHGFVGFYSGFLAQKNHPSTRLFLLLPLRHAAKRKQTLYKRKYMKPLPKTKQTKTNKQNLLPKSIKKKEKWPSALLSAPFPIACAPVKPICVAIFSASAALMPPAAVDRSWKKKVQSQNIIPWNTRQMCSKYDKNIQKLRQKLIQYHSQQGKLVGWPNLYSFPQKPKQNLPKKHLFGSWL